MGRFLRYPAPIIYPIVVQVASYPLGKLLALTLPTTEWGVPTPLRVFGFGETCSFNPGPFNIKEHSGELLFSPQFPVLSPLNICSL